MTESEERAGWKASKRYYWRHRDRVLARRRETNSPERREYQRAWRLKNREKFAGYLQKSRKKHRAKRLAESRAYAKTPKGKASVLRWRKNNLEEHRAYQRRFWHSNPQHRLRSGLAGRIRMAIKRSSGFKAAKTLELIGCSVTRLRAHLEALFVPGMTWENYGPVWHVDHKRPCASFDLSKPEEQKVCFHWTNLQPLFAEENIRKGEKFCAP